MPDPSRDVNEQDASAREIDADDTAQVEASDPLAHVSDAEWEALRATVQADRAAKRNGAEDEIEIARLAALPPLAYEREREAAATRLGLRVSVLDGVVQKHGVDRPRNGKQGRALELREVEPWPEPVDGAALLDELAATFQRFVALPAAAYTDALALWTLHSYCFDAASITPRLAVLSPEKGSGKSTLLDLLAMLTARPVKADSVTTAALFRIIEAARPILLIDEFDSFGIRNDELRGIVNSGHARNGQVIRSVGDEHEPRAFRTFAPVALAAIGRLPGTIEDRAIVIPMRRALASERVERLRTDRPEILEPLKRRCARWAADYRGVVRDADPDVPAALYNRAADNWRVLLALADAAGGTWPERARYAALALSSAGEDQSWRVMLLADIRALFEARNTDRLASEEIVGRLAELDDRPWSEWNSGTPISKAQVARMLSPFKVCSGSIRLPDGTTPKGYYLAGFADAFARYLPPQSATAPQRRWN